MSTPPGSTRPSTRPKQRARPRNARATSSSSSSRMPWLIAALVVVIGLAALIAVMGTGGGGDSTGVESAPVTVNGTPLAAAGGSGMINPASDPAVGKTVPSLAGSTPTGSAISFTPTGKPTVYLFVAHWCPHCQAELPRIATWIDEGRFASNGVVWRTVSTAVDSSRDNYPPSAWFARVKWDEPVMVDSTKGDAATAFGLKSFPYMLFVDGNGVVKQRGTGELTLAEFETGIKAITG